MTRSRSSAKAAGSSHERNIADYLAARVDDRIDRRVKTGAKDRGDIGGLRVLGNRIVLELKDYGGRILASEWIHEAELEAGNDDAQKQREAEEQAKREQEEREAKEREDRELQEQEQRFRQQQAMRLRYKAQRLNDEIFESLNV